MKVRGLSIFGLGKLGCSMLACFAEKGYRVIGVDINENVIEKLNNNQSPIYEPKVEVLINKNFSNIEATSDNDYAIKNSDVSFIIVPTPSLKDGSFSIKYVESAVIEIGKALITKDEYHLVVISSTVLPGDMEKIIETLEKSSNKLCNRDFGLCYNPDFIALGSIVNDFLNPDLVLIGESDSKAGELLVSIHKKTVDNDPIFHRMPYHNAELAKIALNSYCTLKITFANIIAEICENMPEGDASAVTNAIGDDKRVGRKYLRPGLGYGGPCFPRDNRAFDYSSKLFGVNNTFAALTHSINKYHSEIRLPNKIKNILNEKNINEISVLGITYKNDTTLVEESSSLIIVESLLKDGISVKLYDPAGIAEARNELSEFKDVFYCENLNEAVSNSKVCFIGAPWKEFLIFNQKPFLEKLDKNLLIIDSCGVITDANSSINTIKIGINNS